MTENRVLSKKPHPGFEPIFTPRAASTCLSTCGLHWENHPAYGKIASGFLFNGYGEQDGSAMTVNNVPAGSYTLTRNKAGRITSKTTTLNGTTTEFSYTYDDLGRLKTVTKDGTLVESYEHGPNGTRTSEMNLLRGIPSRSFTYSEEDHLLTAGDTTYEYDLDGFLTTKTQGSQVTRYVYSSRGELLSVTLPDGRLIEYVHDPLGRRIAKKIDGAVTEKYLWQGMTRLLAVYDANDNLVQRFQYADGRMPVAMTQSGATYYLAHDQVGSLNLVTDATGAVVKQIDYDSFGNILSETNASFGIPFGFAGGLFDQDTGLIRFGFRDYDPDVGRWTAKDPILFNGLDTNLYGYTENDPVNWVDPWGLDRVYSGYATYYNLPGSKTASGEIFDPSKYTAAMTAEKADLGTDVTVEYSHKDANGQDTTSSCTVTVNDRGPFARGKDGKALKPLRPDPEKIIDLTPTAFRDLAGSLGLGKIPVIVRIPE